MSNSYTLVADEPDFLVIDKAPDVNFHTEKGVLGIVEIVRQDCESALWPVHRLDKMTSGLLLFTKTAAAAARFGEMFQQRAIEKYYLAIGVGKPKKKQGLIKGDMSPSRRKAWKLEASCHNPAVTQFFSQGLGDGLRAYLLKPHTGKTHQLRVALKSLGSPVLGDVIYTSKFGPVDRGYLHAYNLAFDYKGKQYCFTNPPSLGSYFLQPNFLQVLSDYALPAGMPWPRLP